eukprot:5714507-Ditylum_brightwellii.AAC.1
MTLQYYRGVETSIDKNNLKGKTKFIHETDKFLTQFNDLYKNNKEFRGDLLCCLLQSFMAKLSWDPNSQYAA